MRLQNAAKTVTDTEALYNLPDVFHESTQSNNL